MVCVANEVKVECVVCDGEEKTPLCNFTLPVSTTVEELYKLVTNFRKCDPCSFELKYRGISVAEGDFSLFTTLIQLDPKCLNQTTDFILEIHDFPPKPPDSPPKLNHELTDNEDTFFQKKLYKKVIDKPSKPTTSLSRTVDFITSQPTKNYVGLVNQAMTCYLNSLLQALYMTPEFRNALYNWEYADGSDKDQSTSIPYQLQKLFLNLQISTKSAVETTSLTKSFGWDSSEAWQQHDIQELCRVMFDALEKKFKNTEHSNLINRLYEGKMIDYVKCLECKTEKTREDTFLDIPLPVRPFDSTTAYESVEEALTAFVKYETLDGNNQYHCEKCNKKCDAHKGLKFTKFPYILTLHLKRFDFDYKTLFRMKLNDRVTFPYYLNLNSFIEMPVSKESPCFEEDAGMSVKFDDTSTTDSVTIEDDIPPPCNGVAHDQENDEGIDISNGISTTNGITNCHDTENNGSKDEGPYIYDLFSIMIHNGGASGGHYYAYIKDFTTNQWLCFNDTTVTPITESHIERVYGGGPTKAYSSSTNAYMLMYRQIDDTKNDVPMQEEEFPEHIKLLLEKMKESEDDDKKYDDIQLSYKIRVTCFHPKAKKYMLKQIRASQDSTFIELKEKAYEKFSLYGDVDIDQCRLVFYDSLNDLIKHSYEGDETEKLSEIFKNSSELMDLLLEIRAKDQEFEIYKPNGIPMQVYVIDTIREDFIDGPFNVRAHNLQSGIEFKQQLSKIINIDPRNMNVYIKNNPKNRYHIFEDDKILESDSIDIGCSNKAFVTTPSEPVNAEESTPFTILDLIKNFQRVMWLHVQLPNIDKDYTDELQSLALENKEETTDSVDEVDLIESNDCSKIVNNNKDKEFSTQDLNKEKNRNSDDQNTIKTEGISFDCVEEKEKCSIRNSNETTVKWQGLESASEDSSLSDSEKTLVDNSSVKNNSFCEIDTFCDKLYHNYPQSNEEPNYYFKSIFDTSEGNDRLLKVYADERITIETLKKKLEKIVGLSVDLFNVCAQNSVALEMDIIDLNNQLSDYSNGQRFSIILGRALRKREIKLKFYLLNPSCPHEPYKHLFDLYTSKDTRVAQVKEEVIVELKKKHNIDIPLKRLRFRRKKNTFITKIMFNHSKFHDFALRRECEIVIQELQENETVKSSEQIVLFVRLWSRSTLELQPYQEIVLNERSITELMEKIASLSNIPEDCLEIAMGKGNFPCENTNFLNLDNEAIWRTRIQETEKCSITLNNGIIILYRNSKEPLKQLNSEETAEFLKKERSRLHASGIPNYYNHRREKPLKIYFNSD